MSQNVDHIPSNEEIINEISEQVYQNNDLKREIPEELVDSVNNLNIEDKSTCSNVESDKLENEIQDEHPQDNLSAEEMEQNYKEALNLKLQGNTEFKNEQFLDSAMCYTKALKLCPMKYVEDRSILFANRGAAKAKLERNESAIEDCTKALKLNERYIKVYLRRAKLYEKTSKLDESLEDYKKILEIDPGQKDALEAQVILVPKINERNEALKTEMLGKMKDLGNLILRPFGLSTDNFQVNQDPNSGSYSINFKQNSS